MNSDAPKRPPDRPLLVTFCNRAYAPVLANFLAALDRIGRPPLRVYSLDMEAHDLCAASGLDVRPLTVEGSVQSIWRKRIEIFADLLDEGTDFIHSDADAMWLGDPFLPWLAGDSDMIFSQGTIHPKSVHRQWRAVLCCGFFRMNATAAARRFLTLLRADLQRTGDDQDSVNSVLARSGTVWDRGAPDYRLRQGWRTIDCWTTPVTGRSEDLDLTVTLLPHGRFQRIHDPVPRARDVVLKHPLSPKEPIAKLDYFAKTGLLFLDPDWQSRTSPKRLQDFIRPD